MSNEDVLAMVESAYAEWRKEMDESILTPHTQARISFEMFHKYMKARQNLENPVLPEHKARFLEIGKEILTVGMGLDDEQI